MLGGEAEEQPCHLRLTRPIRSCLCRLQKENTVLNSSSSARGCQAAALWSVHEAEGKQPTSAGCQGGRAARSPQSWCPRRSSGSALLPPVAQRQSAACGTWGRYCDPSTTCTQLRISTYLNSSSMLITWHNCSLVMRELTCGKAHMSVIFR